MAGVLTGSMLTLIVFIFTVLLLAVQLASAQFTPRVIARVFQDPGTKIALGVFVFVLTYSLVVLGRLEDPVPKLAGLSVRLRQSLACVAVFVFLIDRLGKELRPVRILTAVAAEGREVIRTIYPQPSAAGRTGRVRRRNAVAREPSHVSSIAAAPASSWPSTTGGCSSWPSEADCVIELVPEVGDFIAPDDPLFRVYRAAAPVDRNATAPVGRHRPGADARSRTRRSPSASSWTSRRRRCRRRSTTRRRRSWPSTRSTTSSARSGFANSTPGRIATRAGRLRLVYRTPDWEDFVQLAVTEIRQFGGESIQVARRLRAMLQSLIQTLPEARVPLLRQELDLLHRSAQRFFPEPEDQAMAEVGDYQGVGGTHGDRRKVMP